MDVDILYTSATFPTSLRCSWANSCRLDCQPLFEDRIDDDTCQEGSTKETPSVEANISNNQPSFTEPNFEQHTLKDNK